MFPYRLKELREEKGLTQEELALMLGLKRQSISNYENGGRQPDYNTLIKIADFFGVTVDYLVGHSDFRTREEEFKGRNFYEKYKLDEVIDDLVDPESKAILGNILINSVEPLIKNISGVLYQHLFGENRKQVLELFKKLIDKLNAFLAFILDFCKNDMYFLALQKYDSKEIFRVLLEKRNIITIVIGKENNEPLYAFTKELTDENFGEMFRDVIKFYSSSMAELRLHQEKLYSVFNEIEKYYSENLKTNVTRMVEEDSPSEEKEIKNQSVKEGESDGSQNS